MQDETLFAKRIRIGRLYDVYGSLLTVRQQKIMEQYFYDDLSLGEIADAGGTSRQAVYDLLKRVEESLEKYERSSASSKRKNPCSLNCGGPPSPGCAQGRRTRG